MTTKNDKHCNFVGKVVVSFDMLTGAWNRQTVLFKLVLVF